MQKAGIFQAYAGRNGLDQPANMDSPIKVYLHVVRPFKQCKVDQSEDAIHTGQIMRVCISKLNLCSNLMTNFQIGQLK